MDAFRHAAATALAGVNLLEIAQLTCDDHSFMTEDGVEVEYMKGVVHWDLNEQSPARNL